MEIPITQFRREIFSLVNQAFDGGEVWVTHKGRRFKIVPEGPPASRLSKITPMQIIAPGINLDDDSWKEEMMREWEQNWDRELARALKPAPHPAKVQTATAERARQKT